jgi:outer membrane receptor for ferrienterochelin and colicin
MKCINSIGRYGCLLIVLGGYKGTFAQPLDEFSSSFGDEEFISIATGQRQHISKAPAVASVITAEDIRALGATDLNEVLETVPGLHVSIDAGDYNPIFLIRGIYSRYNPQVLILINDIPITNVFLGNRSQVWGGMPVESIARIEVIRGPGSAVYGADAYSGVINIITKTSTTIKGTEAGVRAGSFDTYQAWYLHSANIGGWDLSVSAELGTTKGHDETVEVDVQTFFDSLFGTEASLTPGPVSVGADSTDLRFDLSRDKWRFRLGYQGRRNVGTGAGVAQALDPAGKADSGRINADVTFHDSRIAHDWELTVQASIFDTSAESDLVLFPPGTVLPIGSDGNIGTAGGGAVNFPDGLHGNPNVYEQHLRLGADAFFHGFENHVIRIGIGGTSSELEGRETKNFGPGVIDGTEGTVDGTLTDVTGTDFIFIRPEDRKVFYTFIQDEWAFATDWRLTSGVRYDDYSDFGDTVNPRLALIWNADYNLTTKLLYGRAFRAPSFAELFNINNPVLLGNPDLDPEEIDTVELVFDYTSVSGKIRSILNLFRYEMENIIRPVPNPAMGAGLFAQNVGTQEGRGFEIETRVDIFDRTRLFVNYSFQDSEDADTGEDVGYAPGREFHIRLDHTIGSGFSADLQINYAADRKRAAADTRPVIDDYTRVDAKLKYVSEANAEFALLLKNLLDEDIREPSLAPGRILNDLPQAGRHAFAEWRYNW